MANLRILYKNIADTAISLTASNTAGGLVASNMLTEVKTAVHRSTGNFVIYTLTWSTNQRVNCVSLPCTNIPAGSVITVTLKDSGGSTILATNKSSLITFDEPSISRTVNDFPLGKFTSSTVFFSSLATNVRICEISVNAAGIPAGFIDCSKIVVGEYWEPTFNFENGIDLNIMDSSNISRTNAGELVVDRGFVHEKLEFKYALLLDVDRDKLVSIFKEIGTHSNFLVCLFPSNSISTTQNESLFTIYGKRSNTSIIHRSFGYYNHSMEITSW